VTTSQAAGVLSAVGNVNEDHVPKPSLSLVELIGSFSRTSVLDRIRIPAAWMSAVSLATAALFTFSTMFISYTVAEFLFLFRRDAHNVITFTRVLLLRTFFNQSKVSSLIFAVNFISINTNKVSN